MWKLDFTSNSVVDSFKNILKQDHVNIYCICLYRIYIVYEYITDIIKYLVIKVISGILIYINQKVNKYTSIPLKKKHKGKFTLMFFVNNC